jgi:hypothetical protein
MRWILRGVLILIGVLIMLGGALYLLSESREVVILHTRDGGGAERTTHLWVVDDAGKAWLRTGGPDRGWFVRAKANPAVEVERAGEKRPYTATIVEAPETTARVDQLMREKYGWIDALIERLEGGFSTIAVRLDER